MRGDSKCYPKTRSWMVLEAMVPTLVFIFKKDYCDKLC